MVFLRLSPDISPSPRPGGRHSSSHNEALGPFSSPAGPYMAGICEDTVLNTLSPRDKAGTEFSWISASHALSLSRHPSLRGAAPELCLHTRPGVKLPPGEDPGLALHQADPFAPLLHQECFLFSCKKQIASARPLCFSCALPKIMQALNCPAHPSFDLFSAKTPVLPFILWSLKHPSIHPVMVAISFIVKHLQYEQKLPLNTTEEYPDIRPKKNEEIYIIYKARQVTMKNW